jgi:Fe2+ or Zn2+ uptake regulation protein
VNKRKTLQKETLESEIKNINGFFNSKELLKRAKKKNPHIGIATVYRFLNEKKKSNALYSYKCGKEIIFSGQNTSHCHYTCENTGKTTHFTLNSLDFLKNKIPGTITSFQLEVSGKCKKCTSNNSKVH